LIFTETKISGVIIIEPKIIKDDRGYFFESFRADIFSSNIANILFVQDNESFSKYGTIRGLHYQLPPFAQSKLVRVIKGRILDVAVDIRAHSLTFGKYISVELSESNLKQLFIPAGFAHGFSVLSKEAIVQYKVDNYYSKEHERSILYSDPSIGIDWGIDTKNVILSDKDASAPLLKNAQIFKNKMD
jgi:dTDP-4-dehydrorhamnose 3,5-epimerase